MKTQFGRPGFSRVPRTGKAAKTAFLSLIAAILLGFGLSAGCGGDDDEPFLIGLSVLDVPAFRQMRNAANFAVADINATGGNVALVDSKLDNELVFNRDNASPENLVRELLDRGVRGLIPTTSSASETIFDFITENRLVTIAPGASSDKLTDLNEDREGQHYFFRTLPHNDYQAEVLADIVKDAEGGKVAIIYRNDEWGRDIKEHFERHLGNSRQVSSVALPAFGRQQAGTDEGAREVVREFERASGISEIRDADSVIFLMYLPDAKVMRHMLDSSALPENPKYYIPETLALSQRLHQVMKKEDEDAEDAAALLEGFKGVIPFPHSTFHAEQALEHLRDFECRFPHDIEDPEQDLHYATYTYDAVVVMALAALAAGSTDPSRYVREVANVTREGTKCESYAECRRLLTDADSSNDDIDYEGLSGPIDLDGNTGNVTDAFYAVYTYDGTIDGDGRSGRARDFEEVKNGKLRPLIPAHERPERPLRECPNR